MTAKQFTPDALAAELRRITDWWLASSPDTEHGGFVGEIDHAGNPVPGADKGLVLNSRLLWFFSSMAGHTNDDRCRGAAERAWQYLEAHFNDPEHGGAYWSLQADGTVRDGKKQVYALCFCIYAFCAWYEVSGDADALARALEYVDLIETRARDDEHGGYLEAFTREWGPIDDFRLGATDLNAPKTMNTHLHLLEAYTAVHRVAPDDGSAQRLRYALELLREKILDRTTGHLALFFDRQWNSVANVVSYGHDIEASWLLWEAVEVLDDDALANDARPDVLALAGRCLEEGLDPAQYVRNEHDLESGHRDDAAVWWVQAEALVGFLNAAMLSGDARFAAACEGVWDYIVRYQVDPNYGDWHWFSTRDPGSPDAAYKAGFWKGPYHNGRALLECLARSAAR